MRTYTEKALAFRACAEPHYNCAQSVLLAFADLIDLPEDSLYAVASNFGGGMKVGGTCGAITGGLMALGLLGKKTPEIVCEFQERMQKQYDGLTDCDDLLRVSAEQGISKADNCNGLVAAAVKLVESYL